MEMVWVLSEGIVKAIKIAFGCFFAVRLFHKPAKSVKAVGKLLLWAIVYGIILFLARWLFYDKVQQLLFVVVTGELVLFAINCGQAIQNRRQMQFAQRKQPMRSAQTERTVFVILVVVTIVILLVVILGRKMGDTPVEFFNMLAAISLFLLDFGVWKAVSVFQKAKREKEELAAQNQAAKLQLKSQKEISAVYEQMRALKHDMKSHLYTVAGLLEMGEYQKAQEYIGQIEEKTEEGDFTKTQNPVIDALLTGKGALARKERIRVKVSAALKAELLIRDSDLIIVLGNLYDNAVEACMKIATANKDVTANKDATADKDVTADKDATANNMVADNHATEENHAAAKESKRWIRIQLVSTPTDFMIVFENPVAQTQTMADQQSKRKNSYISNGYANNNHESNNHTSKTKENYVWKSTKPDSECHGYGMKNIDRTVKAYGGYCSRTIENGIFSCHIRMPNCTRNGDMSDGAKEN